MYNLLNPTVIIEVLSKSAQGNDRWEKFVKYRRIESLAEHVLVAQDKPHFDRYLRKLNTEWLLSEVKGLRGVVQLSSINCKLKLAEVYDKVKFPQ